MIAFSYSAPNLKNPFENPNTNNLEAIFDQNLFFGQNTYKCSLFEISKIKRHQSSKLLFQNSNSLSVIKILALQIEIEL